MAAGLNMNAVFVELESIVRSYACINKLQRMKRYGSAGQPAAPTEAENVPHALCQNQMAECCCNRSEQAAQTEQQRLYD